MKNIFKYKLFQRSIVFVLLVSLLMTAMPVYAISSSNTPELNESVSTNDIDNTDGTVASSTTTIPTKLTDKDNVYISAEEVSKRGEFEKHYLLSDGSFVAVSYPEAVHYKNDDGKWEEVDNQLSYDTKTSRIVNGQNGFSVSFAEKPSGNSLASLLHDGIPFSWTLSATKKLDSGKNTKLTAFSTSTANIIQAEKVSLASTVSRANIAETSVIGKKVTDADAFTNDKLSGKLGYAKLFNDAPEISVDYSVYHNKIEEDIYINSPTDLRSFSMEIQANGLTAIVNDDGSVDFVDADGTMQYRIGIPYMQDANNEVLNDIEVTATLNGDVWTVTYTPDEEWLTSEERAYPILLDPSVTTNEYYCNITDTYVYEGNTANHSSEQNMYIGLKAGLIYRTYVRLNYLPSIDDISPILGATMQLSFASGTTTGKTAEVYKASSSWNPSTLTYANQPTLLSSNLLSTCDYNLSIQSLTFDITEDIAKLHDASLAEPNYGYVVKYVDEDPDYNPDYNMFCSMEHTNAAKRPVITINYGYVLPSTLTNGGVYAFQNADTNYFLAVDGGEDANDVNVFTEAVDETYDSFIFLPQNLFKLEYIPSTGAYYLRAMCSSNGTNRVLDVVKYGGYPDYGSNVQIYTPTDSLAQHWLIIATGEDTFKIVIRNDTSLLLTENTDYENVELMFEIDEDEYCQEWRIYNTSGQMIRTPYITSIDDDIYYFNNLYHGKYLHNGNGTPNTASGLIEDLEDTIRWKVTHVGNNTYTIQSMDDMSKYLRSVDSLYVELSTPSTLTNDYLWTFTKLTSNEYLIRNVATSKYLRQYTASSLTLESSLGITGSWLYNESVWRTVNTFNYAGKELTSFSIDDIIIDVGGSTGVTINKLPSDAIWTNTNDFTFSKLSGTSNNLLVNWLIGSISSTKIGITEYRATHNVTGVTCAFKVYVDRYTYELNNFFGFDADVSLLIRDLYNRIDNVFSSETATQRAWRASRLLSEFIYEGPMKVYDNFPGGLKNLAWDIIAGTVTSPQNREEYFIETLDYTEEEYVMICSAIVDQYNDNQTSDFPHMQYALAARLRNYMFPNNPDAPPEMITIDTDYLSKLAGWLGDATLKEDGTTSLKNDDYMADLDAENIYRIIIDNSDSISAINDYYALLATEDDNRATIFKSHTSYTSVQASVLYGLLSTLDKVKIECPDTYNFLMSLRDDCSEIVDYITEG